MAAGACSRPGGCTQCTCRATSGSLDSQLEKAAESRPADDQEVPVRGHAPEGDPATVLVEAGAQGALLVLGRRGHGRRQRKLIGPQLGSVAGHCLSHASVPVVIVPPDSPASPPARVLVGIDGSAPSARALRWAVQHAGAVGAPVVAVFAWQLTTITPPASTGEDWSVPPLPEWAAQARQQLEDTVTTALPPEQAEQSSGSCCTGPPPPACSRPPTRPTCWCSASAVAEASPGSCSGR